MSLKRKKKVLVQKTNLILPKYGSQKKYWVLCKGNISQGAITTTTTSRNIKLFKFEAIKN